MWEWGWEGRCSYAQIWQSVVVVGGQALQANGHSLIVLWWCEFRLWYCFNATAASCLKGRGLSDWGFLSIIDYFSVLKHLEETFIMILLCINNIELNLHRGWSFNFNSILSWLELLACVVELVAIVIALVTVPLLNTVCVNKHTKRISWAACCIKSVWQNLGFHTICQPSCCSQ